MRWERRSLKTWMELNHSHRSLTKSVPSLDLCKLATNFSNIAHEFFVQVWEKVSHFYYNTIICIGELKAARKVMKRKQFHSCIPINNLQIMFYFHSYLCISWYCYFFFHVILTCIQSSPPKILQTIHFFDCSQVFGSENIYQILHLKEVKEALKYYTVYK